MQSVTKAVRDRRPEWADELLDLVVQEATGRFVVASRAGEYAWMWLRDGQLSGVSAAARRPLLSRRLLAFRILTQDQLEKALAAIRDQPGQRLLDRVIQDRLAPLSFIDAYVRHVTAEQMASMLHTSVDDVSFEPGRVQRVSPLLLDVHDMMAAAAVTPFVIPDEIAEHVLTATHPDFPHSYAIQRAVLAASDGRHRPVEVADLCGLTAGETLQIIADLEGHGVLALAAGPQRDNWMDVSAEEPAALDAAPAAAEDEAVPVIEAAPPTAPAAPPPAPAEAEPVPAAEPKPEPGPEPAAEPEHTARPSFPPPAADEHPVAGPEQPEELVRLPEPSPASRRDAMSLLASLTDSIAAEPTPPPTPEPQAEVTTTSRAPVWTSRQSRPNNPMESGEVFRELASLGDEGNPAPNGGATRIHAEGKDKKRKLFGR